MISAGRDDITCSPAVDDDGSIHILNESGGDAFRTATSDFFLNGKSEFQGAGEVCILHTIDDFENRRDAGSIICSEGTA